MFVFNSNAKQDRLVKDEDFEMPTFVLKKYEEKTQTTNPEENQEPQSVEPAVKKEMTVEISGSISEIVANALNKVLVNKNVEMTEQENAESSVKAISTEDINNDPLTALNNIKQTDVLLISGTGFTTPKEEWFLTNIEDKVDKVFYSVEAFVNYIAGEFTDV